MQLQKPARPGWALSRSNFARHAAQRPGLLAATLIAGFVVGIAYRVLVDSTDTQDLTNYLRSGLHGVGFAFTGWVVDMAFASNAQSSLGSMLRRLPVSGEVLVRSLVMTVALIIVGTALQLVLYAEPLQSITPWLITTLPHVVAIAFTLSLVFGVVAETGRLIGGPMLTSIVLGTHHRPVREQLIVMFLDIAGSTRLAEEMGELRVHDLITRFFFDIDEPIKDHRGVVHTYVGDEVIVTWPITRSPANNARCLACFFAIERKMAQLAVDYDRDFGVVPNFRAGLHAGSVIVSECGDSKRQLAYFGDTMNVAARLCDYCKAVNRRLVISGNLLHELKIPADLKIDDAETIALRGRKERIKTHTIHVPARQAETTL